MTATPQLLTADHIDLLITAALRWRILTDRTTAAFTPAENHLVVATATEAARILQQENLAALRWLSDRGRARLADHAVPDPHLFSEVDALDPVEVIKACHAAQHLCSPAPGWAGSTAHRLLAAISTAATHRLPGYAEAPWIWTRPQVRAGRPVALGTRWRPNLPGISWVSVAELIPVWQSAALVVITTEAAADLPVGLPARSGLFLLAGSDPPDEVWDAVAAASPEAVLYWPACSDWLAEQAHDPSSRFTHHRGGELAGPTHMPAQLMAVPTLSPSMQVGAQDRGPTCGVVPAGTLGSRSARLAGNWVGPRNPARPGRPSTSPPSLKRRLRCHRPEP